MTNNEIARALLIIAFRSDMTFDMICRKAEIDRQTLTRMANGQVPRRSLLEKLAPALNVEVIGDELEWTSGT